MKNPVHTSVSIEQNDFEDFVVEDDLHIGISVKDFRAIVAHANSLSATLTARFTRPGRPLQLAYDGEAMRCEFTLMTRSDSGTAASESRATTPQVASQRAQSKARQFATGQSNVPPSRTSAASTMAPPPAKTSHKKVIDLTSQTQPGGSLTSTAVATAPPSTSMSNSLFFPPDPDDRQWDEPSYRDDEDDMLGWDASADNVSVKGGSRRHMISENSRLSCANPSSTGRIFPSAKRWSPVRQRAGPERGGSSSERRGYRHRTYTASIAGKSFL